MDPQLLKGLSPEKFERLCLRLIKKLVEDDVDRETVKRRGKTEAKDQGIDIEATIKGDRYGYQCKTGMIGKKEMEDVFDRIRRYPHSLDSFILLLGQHPSAPAIDQFLELKKIARTQMGSIRFVEYWDPDNLVQKIEEYPDLRAFISELLELPSTQYASKGIRAIDDKSKLRGKLVELQEKVASFKEGSAQYRDTLLSESEEIKKVAFESPDRDIAEFAALVDAYLLLKLNMLEDPRLSSASRRLRRIGGGSSIWGAAAVYVRGKVLQTLSTTREPFTQRRYLAISYDCWTKIKEPFHLKIPILLPGIRSEALPDWLDEQVEGEPDPFTKTVPVPYRYRAAEAVSLAAFSLNSQDLRADDIARAKNWLELATKDCIESGRGGLPVPFLALNIRLTKVEAETFESVLDEHAANKRILSTYDTLLKDIDDACSRAEIPIHKHREWTAFCFAGRASFAGEAEKRTIIEDLNRHVRSCLEVNGGRTTPFRVDKIYHLAHMHKGHILDDEYRSFLSLLKEYDKSGGPLLIPPFH